jgi:hypothetical protein
MKCCEYDYKAYNVSNDSKSYWQNLWETTIEIKLPRDWQTSIFQIHQDFSLIIKMFCKLAGHLFS